MKRFISRAVAVILTCALAFGSAVCFAADSTESADAKKYYDYGTYVLLGDSVASGHNDLVYVNSEFKRVENSYGAYVADALGVNYVPMACPGFRTIDIRYMLEDDYPGDDYLFHDSHDPEVMKTRIPEYRRAISQAGLITLGRRKRFRHLSHMGHRRYSRKRGHLQQVCQGSARSSQGERHSQR